MQWERLELESANAVSSSSEPGLDDGKIIVEMMRTAEFAHVSEEGVHQILFAATERC